MTNPPTTAGVLLGVLVAVAAFIVQRAMVSFIEAYRFRRRLAAVVEIVITDIIKSLGKIVERRSQFSANEGDLGPIWANAPLGLEDVHTHSSDLEADIFAKTIAFYDAMGRLLLVVEAHNQNALSIVRNGSANEYSIQFAHSCYTDLHRICREILETGSEVLSRLSFQYEVSIDPELREAVVRTLREYPLK
jgi:hypothetical protein